MYVSFVKSVCLFFVLRCCLFVGAWIWITIWLIQQLYFISFSDALNLQIFWVEHHKLENWCLQQEIVYWQTVTFVSCRYSRFLVLNRFHVKKLIWSGIFRIKFWCHKFSKKTTKKFWPSSGIQIFVAILRQYIEIMLLHHALNYWLPLKICTKFRK